MNAPINTESAYQVLRKINVNDHTEKKNGLTYLSWAWAVDQLLNADPAANWSYAEPKMFGETMMVFCTVTAFGKSMTAQLPVMDYKNRAIPNPNAFEVNTAMQRCLAKAIALHGLGLYIYAGEDVPPDADKSGSDKPDTPKLDHKSVPASEFEKLDPESQKYIRELADEVLSCKSTDEQVQFLANVILEVEEKAALWSLLDSKTRSAIKKASKLVQA